MFNSIYLNSYGNNIFNTLGALNGMKEDISNIVIWNCSGNSSLVLFFKIFGYTFEQTFENLKKFDICNSLINGFSFMVENESEKKTYVREYLLNIASKNKLLNYDITLKEVYKKTNIFPCFVLRDKVNQRTVNVNPKDNYSFNLIDCVLASLTGIGTWLDYSIENNFYSNLLSADCYPYKHCFHMENNLETLYLFNNMNYGFDDINANFGPLQNLENEIIRQQFERIKIKLESTKKELNSGNLLILTSEFCRKKVEDIKIDGYFKSGEFQAGSFKIGEETEKGLQKHLNVIANQN